MLQVFLHYLSGFVLSSGTLSFIPVLPIIRSDFHLEYGQVGTFIAISGLGMIIAGWPVGRLAERVHVRWITAAGFGFVCLGSVGVGIAQSYPALLTGRFLVGIGFAASLTASIAGLSRIATAANSSRIMALLQGAMIAGGIVGPLLGGFLGANLGWRTVFIANAVLAGLPVTLAVLPLGDLRRVPTSSVTTNEAGSDSSARFVVGAAFIYFAIIVFRSSAQSFLFPVIGKDTLGVGTSLLGFLLALSSLTNLLATYPVGILADQYGKPRILGLALACLALAALTLFLIRSYSVFVVSMVATGLGGTSLGLVYAIFADHFRTRRSGTGITSFRIAGDLGALVGPYGVGRLAERGGPFMSLLAISALLILAALCLAVMTSLLKEVRQSLALSRE